MPWPKDHEYVGGVTIGRGIDLVILKRKHSVTPFIITGYFSPKDMVGEEYWACTDEQGARGWMQKMALQFMVMVGM